MWLKPVTNNLLSGDYATDVILPLSVARSPDWLGEVEMKAAKVNLSVSKTYHEKNINLKNPAITTIFFTKL